MDHSANDASNSESDSQLSEPEIARLGTEQDRAAASASFNESLERIARELMGVGFSNQQLFGRFASPSSTIRGIQRGIERERALGQEAAIRVVVTEAMINDWERAGLGSNQSFNDALSTFQREQVEVDARLAKLLLLLESERTPTLSAWQREQRYTAQAAWRDAAMEVCRLRAAIENRASFGSQANESLSQLLILAEGEEARLRQEHLLLSQGDPNGDAGLGATDQSSGVAEGRRWRDRLGTQTSYERDRLGEYPPRSRMTESITHFCSCAGCRSRRDIGSEREFRIQIDRYHLGTFCPSPESGRGRPDSIGDTQCKYNARSPYLRCAINPTAETCKGCRDLAVDN